MGQPDRKSNIHCRGCSDSIYARKSRNVREKMNLVEAVNKALGTNGSNLQGALNQAANEDATNITEAISLIEGGGGGGYNPPRITIDGNNVATCDTSYEDFLSLQNAFGNIIDSAPCLFIYDSEDLSGVSWATAYFYDGYISMSDGELYFYYLSDGTITDTRPGGGK